MAAVVEFLLSLLLTPLLIPVPEEPAHNDEELDNDSFVSVSHGPGIRSTALSECTRSAGRTTPDRTTATATETTNPYFAARGHHDKRGLHQGAGRKPEARKYVEESFLMRLRKISVALMFGAVAICSCIAIAMLIFTHTAASNRGAGVHIVIGAFAAFNSVWTATYFRVAWTKQSTDGVVHFMLIGTFVVDVGINLGSINYIPRPTEMSFLLAFALLLQAPHMPRYFAAIIALSCWCAYNDFAVSAGWTTLTLPNPYTYDDFTIVDSAIRISGAIVMMLFVMFLLYLQSENNKRQIHTAESAVKVAAAVAERLGDYDTAGAKMALQIGNGQSVHDENDNDDVSEGQSLREGNFPAGDLASQMGSRHGSTSPRQKLLRRETQSEREAIELDPKLLDAFQRLLVNLNAYRPYLPNWLLQSNTVSDDNEGEMERDRHSAPTLQVDACSGDDEEDEYGSAHRAATGSGSPHSSKGSSARGGHGAHVVSAHAQAQAQAQKSNKTAPVSHATFAAIQFWLDPETPASQTECDLATSQFVELVLKEANAAKAAVHYSALGEILLSWNVCRSDPAPEAKAARFLSEVQSCLSAANSEPQQQRSPKSNKHEGRSLAGLRRQTTVLHLVRVAGAAVTGTIRTGEFGVKQRLRVDYAPGLRARLACLSKLARQLLLSNASSQNAAFDFSPAPMLSLVDSALSTQAEHSFHIAHAGAVVVHSRRDARKDAKASLLSSAEVPSTEQHQIFQLMGTRQSDDEWLYAMAEGAVDVWSDAWRKAYGPTLKRLKGAPRADIKPWMSESPHHASLHPALVSCVASTSARSSMGSAHFAPLGAPQLTTAIDSTKRNGCATPPLAPTHHLSDGRGIIRLFDHRSANGTPRRGSLSADGVAGVATGESVHSIDEPNASTPMSPQDPITIAGLPEHCLVAIPDDAAAQIQGAVARVASMEGSAALRHSAATRALLDYVDRKLLVLYLVPSA